MGTRELLFFKLCPQIDTPRLIFKMRSMISKNIIETCQKNNTLIKNSSLCLVAAKILVAVFLLELIKALQVWMGL